MLFGSRLNRLATSIRRGISKYSVGSDNPGLVFDFIDNFYQKDKNQTVNFDGAITHARSSNATMTDGYGPELVTNGGFDSDSDWTLGTGWSIADGKATSGGTQTSNSSLTQGNGSITTEGTVYEVSFNVTRSAGTIQFYLRGQGAGSLSASGSYVYYLVASSGSDDFAFVASSNFVGSIDSVSVREMPVLKWAPHNLLSYSEDLSNSYWTEQTSTVTANQATAPDGTSTADLLVPDSGTTSDDGATSNHGVRVTVNTPASQKPTASAFFKKETARYATMRLNISAIDGRAVLDLDTGAISVSAHPSLNAEVSATDVGNGWYRVDFKINYTGGSNFKYSVGASTVAPSGTYNRSTTGDGTSGVYIWGAHAFRSDLGGMVDNPDQPLSRASYVPTTSSAKYLPRIGHHVFNGSAWSNAGLLAESESRTNLVTYSEDFTDSSWTTSASSVTKKTGIVAPDGSENVYHFQEDTNNTQHQLTTNLTAGTQVFSVFAKGDGSGRYLKLYGYGLGTAGEAPVFDVDNGIVYEPPTQTHFLSASIQDVGNGWYRCSLRADTDAGTGDPAFALVNATNSHGTVGYTGDGTSGVYLYGAQLEATSGQASSYIPTSGSSVTRAAETFTIPSANLPWPEPNYIGSQLVINGTFDTDVSGWTGVNGATVAYSSGRAEVTIAAQSGSGIESGADVSVVSGKLYIVNADVEKGTYSGNSVILNLLGTARNIDIASTGVTTVSSIFYSSNTTDTKIKVLRGSADTGTLYVDNVSVREIDPLSVSIAMDGRMTYADEDASGQQRLYSWRDDASNRLNLDLYTNSTNEGTFIIDQVASGTYDNASSGEVYSPDVLVPFNVSSRHGSTFVNLATDGTSHTANTTPTALPDLSATDLDLAENYMGTIGTFRVWDKDLGDDGLVEATNPSLEPSLSLTFEGTGTNSFVVNNWSE